MAFRDIVGHGTMLALVSRAISLETLPPSLLLVGPEGVGKRLVALAIAQTVNCVSPRRAEAAADGGVAVDACGRCAVCRRIDRGTFPDVLTLAPPEGGALTVDVVRAALDQAGYRPFEARRRVVIVDDAERMVPAAQNALLKTLEEPPPSTGFVLVSAHPDLLLDTVRSRCPRLRFGLLDPDEIATVLTDRLDIAPEVARPAAATAGGSVGRAAASASGRQAASRDAALALLESVATARDARGRLAGAKSFAAGSGTRAGARRAAASERLELRHRLQALTSLLRDLEVMAAESSVPLANADLERSLHRLVEAFGQGRSRRGFAVVGEAMAAVEGNASPKVVADWVACRL